MPEALVTLPDGRKAKVTFTDQAQLDATIADLTKPAGGGAPKTAPEAPGTAPHPLHGNLGVGAAETALKLGTGLASSAAGGVAGLARGVGAGAAALAGGEGLGAARDAFTTEATDTIKAVGEAGTYQPRTQYGKLESALVEAPFKLLAKGANVAGEKTAELTGSPALGAAVNTAIQSAPAIVGAKVGRIATEAGRGAEAEAGATPRGTAATPESRAQSYAGNLGLDWARLPAALKTTLTRIAKDSGNLEKLNPEAVKRQALLEGQRIPIATTRGKLTRDPVELRREAVASTTAEGQPIRDVDIAANRDLQANLEVLRGKVAGQRGGLHDPNAENAPSVPSIRAPTKAQADVGASIQGELRGKAAASKKAYDALYKKARETDPEATASIEPVSKMLAENPEIQHLGWVQGWLAKAARAKQAASGAPEVEPVTEAKLAELHDLRSTANDIARTGGKEGYYAGKVVKAIDETMESVPEGAKAWKQANAAFKRHQKEFKDQALIKQLTTNKGGDRTLALEKTWNTIAKAPVEKIRQVKQSLLTQEGPKSTRMQGRAAWRDLRGETVNRILEDARNVVATDETERSILTAAALRKSINSVGRDRLTEILGKRNTDQLYDLLRAAKITRTDPAHRVTESGTVPNALVLAEKLLKHIPGAKTLVGAKHAISDLTERGRAAEAVKQSTKTPLEVAAEEAERRAGRRTLRLRRRDTSLQALRGASPGVGGIPEKRE
jgi:hypothetical protein